MKKRITLKIGSILMKVLVFTLILAVLTFISSVAILYAWSISDNPINFENGKNLLFASGTIHVMFFVFLMIGILLSIEKRLNEGKSKDIFFYTSITLITFASIYLIKHSREYFGEDTPHINDITCNTQILDNSKVINCGDDYIYLLDTETISTRKAISFDNHKEETL